MFAQAFDAGKLALSGEPIRVASGVPLRLPPGGSGSSAITRSAIFAVSQNGVLAFRTGGAAPAAQAPGNEERRTLLWFGRNTQVFGSVGIPAAYVGLDLSPDGKRVTFHRHEARGGDSWVLDLAQDRVQRLTFDASLDNASPIWSPDGARIVFSSQRNGKEGLYVKAADGSATEELVVESEAAKVPMSWSPDGKLIVYAQNTGAGDVWAVPVTGDKKPFPLLQSPAAEQFPQVSPDGKWLAYQSNETGRNEIYVKPFPDGAGKWQVSTDGGTFPRWRGDSKELYFYLDNQMFAADIRAAGSSVEAGSPRVLFGLPSPSTLAGHSPYHRYAVTADGQRFLVSILGAAPGRGRGADLASNVASLAESSNALGGVPGAVSPVTVVLNWERMLKGK